MATISGTVKNSSGAWKSTRVQAFRKHDKYLSGEAISNASDGTFSITTPDTTPHTVIVYDADWDYRWGDTRLMLPMTDTGLTDAKGNTVTINSPATRSSAQSKFDGYSCDFTGGGSLSISGAQVITGDCTIEAYVYTGSNTGTKYPFQIGNEATGRIVFIVDAGILKFDLYGIGTTSLGTATIPTSQQVHIAYVRSGSTFTGYINGTSTGTATRSGNIGNTGGYSVSFTGGYMSWFRHTAYARYTSNFTPPAIKFASNSLVTPTENALIYDNITPV